MPRITPSRIERKRKEISILEIMPFHHEVWLAFCIHAINLGININIKSPGDTGIHKAINGIAADGLSSLYQLAREKSVEIRLERADTLGKLVSSNRTLQPLFISTIPIMASQLSRKQSELTRQLVRLIRENLASCQQILLTIHDPGRDIKQLCSVFTDQEMDQFIYITLSHLTADALTGIAPHLKSRILVMPALSMGNGQRIAAHLHADRSRHPLLVVPGEVSSRRRNYEALSALTPIVDTLRADNLKIKIIGRIKRESWIDKLAYIMPIPAAWIFLLKYPSILKLSMQRIIDLSLVKRTKVSESSLQQMLSSSWALLDLQLKRYTEDGITSGLTGLSLSHAKATLSVDQLLDFFQDKHQSKPLERLKQFLQADEERLVQDRDIQVSAFRASLAALVLEQ